MGSHPVSDTDMASCHFPGLQPLICKTEVLMLSCGKKERGLPGGSQLGTGTQAVVRIPLPSLQHWPQMHMTVGARPAEVPCRERNQLLRKVQFSCRVWGGRQEPTFSSFDLKRTLSLVFGLRKEHHQCVNLATQVRSTCPGPSQEGLRVKLPGWKGDSLALGHLC